MISTLRQPRVKDVQSKTVLVRVDYNVPLSEKGGSLVVADDLRIRESLETLEFLLKHNAKILLVTHLGRPTTEKEPQFSLAPVAEHLSKLLKQPVTLLSGSLADTKKQLATLPFGQVAMLENIRYFQEEEAN